MRFMKTVAVPNNWQHFGDIKEPFESPRPNRPLSYVVLGAVDVIGGNHTLTPIVYFDPTAVGPDNPINVKIKDKEPYMIKGLVHVFAAHRGHPCPYKSEECWVFCNVPDDNEDWANSAKFQHELDLDGKRGLYEGLEAKSIST